MYELGVKHMEDSVPRIEQVCDGCTVGKQHRKPFPGVASFRAKERLEITHDDLGGSITPTTPGGNMYFMLIVQDYLRYMWLELSGATTRRSSSSKRVCSLRERAWAEAECVLDESQC
jgi:hypothetical protein